MNDNADTSAVMTIKQVADYLKVAERTVYRLAGEQKLPGFKVGTTWRFRRADLYEWIDAQSRTKPHSSEPQ